MQKITPFLSFDGKAEEATNFYMSIFKHSKRLGTMRYPEGAPAPAGSVMGTTFALDGQEFLALNGGPQFTFAPAISLFVSCDSQEEIDHYWESLSAGGEKVQCGWLKDKYGVSWQVVPKVLGDMLQDADKEKASRVMKAMMKMQKLDIGELKRAQRGG